MMNREEFDNRKRMGSVKAAVRLYGDRILEDNTYRKPQLDISEMKNLKTRQLHKAKRDIGRYKETRAEADSLKAQAEFELHDAQKTVRDLSSLLRDSSSKTQARKQEIDTLRRSARHERQSSSFGNSENRKYEEVMRELESVKQELRMLKLDMAAVLEEKSRVERQIDVSRAKVDSSSSSLEVIKDEIEKVNDELVLVELARIEAMKERGEIEAERAKEAIRFSHAIDQTNRKIKDLSVEIEQSKEFEPKLASTLADIDVLQHELREVKEMEKRVQRSKSLRRSSFRAGQDLEPSLSLETVTEELQDAKKELASVKEEGFQYMASMDIIRNELKRAKSETARLQENEKTRDLTVQNLNAKLLRAKAKLEAVTTAEERANSIVSNLSVTLEQLKEESEAAKKENVLIVEETAGLKAEFQKIESETASTEEKLEAAMQDLEAAKSSEGLALENLKTRIENTIETRTSVLQHSSSITISKFEYEYLKGRAIGAEELANKKVSAAKAWIEAIKANEKEIMMKIEFARREMREMRLEEDRESYKMERTFSAKRTVERELQNWRTKREKNTGIENNPVGANKRSTRGHGNGNLTPSRRPKFRASASPAGRNSFPIKKKRQVIPNLARFFKSTKTVSNV